MQFTRKTLKEILSFLPGIAKEDRGVMAICIAIALIFWLILNLARDYTINELVAVNYQLPNDLLLAENPQDVLDVSIRAQGWNILWASLKKSDISINVDVAKLEEGRLSKGEVAQLIERELSNSNFEISDLNFNATSLKTIKKSTKKVPLVLDAKIKFAQGYTTYGHLEQSFDSVTISGPVTALDTIHRWLSQPFQRSELKGNISADIPLQPSYEGIEVLSGPSVRIQQMVELVTERLVFVPVEVINAPKDSFSIFPTQIRLKVSVAQSQYHHIIPDSFRVIVNMLEANKGSEQSNTLALHIEKQPASALKVDHTPKAIEFYVFSKQR